MSSEAGAYFNYGGDFPIFNTDTVFNTGNLADDGFAIRLSGMHTPETDWFNSCCHADALSCNRREAVALETTSVGASSTAA